jgi:hypothetical protein
MQPLRDFVLEVIKASPDYMKKEAVRERLQELIQRLVDDGSIRSDDELSEFFLSATMALNALKMVPLPVWKNKK